ncbi:MAG: hypothetical protein AMXMBFR57_16360 [Acidimicrobiia bacterium]
MNPTRVFASGLAVCLAATFSGPVTATQAPPQVPSRAGAPQDAPSPPTSAVVLGQVVDGDTGQPVADAVVSVTVSSRQAGASGGLAGNVTPGAGGARRVLTTAEGRFVIRDLPAGTVQMTVTASGYLNGSYGQTRPGGAPEPLRIRDGEAALTARLRIWRTSSITGVVRDARGEPLVRQQVRALFKTFQRGQPRVSARAVALTDDRGVYYLSGLQPGDYLVSVAQTMVSTPATMLDTMMSAMMGGDMSGAMAMADVAMSGGAMAVNGTRVGDMVVGTTTGDLPRTDDAGRTVVLAGRFAPEASTSAEAVVVTLGTGEVRTGVDVALPYVRTVSVSGRVTGPSGPASGLPVRLIAVGETLLTDNSMDVAAATTRADGSFMMPAVPPGTYVLRAMRTPRMSLPAAQLAEMPEAMRQAMQQMMAAPGEDARALYAEIPLSVSGDVADVSLVLSAGATVSGRFEFQGTGAPPGLTGARVALTSLDGRWSTPGTMLPMSAGNMEADAGGGTFVAAGQPPGRYIISITPPNFTGWFVRSIVADGRDVTYGPIELGERDITGVVITYTDKSSSIGGQVQLGEAGRVGATVVLFPRAWREWVANGMHQALSRSLRTVETGAFAINNLPPHEYLIAAVPNDDAPNMQDPAVFAALERIATAVRVGEGESQRVSPRLQVWR